MQADGVSGVWSQALRSYSGAATHVEKSIQLAADGSVVAEKSLVDAGVAFAADPGVSFALLVGVGVECPLCWEDNGVGGGWRQGR